MAHGNAVGGLTSALMVFAVAGCMAGSDGVARRGDQRSMDEIRRAQTFDVTGAAVGDDSADEASGRASWQAACDRWTRSFGEVASAKVISVDCGSAQRVGAGWQFASQPVAHVEGTLPLGDAPETFSVDLHGAAAASTNEALAAWSSECDGRIRELAIVYRERLLAATCTTPTADTSGGTGAAYGSRIDAWIVPAAGLKIEVLGQIIGDSSTDPTVARLSWEEACATWLETMASISGAERLGGVNCGSPDHFSGSPGGHLESFANVTVFAAIPLDAPPGTESFTVQGAADPNPFVALHAWQSACEKALGQLEKDRGDKLLAATCGNWAVASRVSPFSYTSTGQVWIAPDAQADGGCAHRVDARGPGLDASTCGCAATICATDSFCCEQSWDGLCVSEAATACPAADPVAPGTPGLPAGWTCDAVWYNDGQLCNCDCGAVDPDCAVAGLPIEGCSSQEFTCSAEVTCVPK